VKEHQAPNPQSAEDIQYQTYFHELKKIDQNNDDLDSSSSIVTDILRNYLKDFSQYPLLTTTQERQLTMEFQALNENINSLTEQEKLKLETIKEQLICANLRLVVSIAKRYQGNGVPLIDLIQEGNIGLMTGIKKFAPTKGFKVSTYVTLNGSAPRGGTFVLLERTPPGSGNFNVALDGISPVTGTQFSWNGAKAGTQYELVVTLKNSSKNDVATSNSVIVTAPATGANFTINSNLSLQPPQSPVTLSCGNKNASNNTWSATVNYPSVPGAQAYWLQLGTTNGGNNLVNVTQLAASGNFQTVNVNLNDSVTYYARYAYSYSPNPTTNNYYSSFSGSYSFKCPQ